jgi:serine protease Do
MSTKQLFLAALASSCTIAGILYGSDRAMHSSYSGQAAKATEPIRGVVILTGFRAGQAAPGRSPANFIGAARTAIAATVHITVRNRRDGNPFNPYAQPGNGSGSGAIISQDGYLVTNNHVVEDASDIRVILSNRRSFAAKMIGNDPANDLAVLKIEAAGLPFLLFENSEETKPGQWVLAAGYPLDLGTTVTAGIVSARPSPAYPASPTSPTSPTSPGGQTPALKARYHRSLIQTDAVINHGNSGCPLVNAEGRLIGINSYFASPTGAYAGYSFAIPVNIVKKVVNSVMTRP